MSSCGAFSTGFTNPFNGSTGNGIRIAIADADPIARFGTRALLSAHHQWVVVGEIGSRREIDDLLDDCPDVLVIDPVVLGFQQTKAVRSIIERCPSIGILILSARSEPWVVRDVLRAGVFGYVLRSEAISNLEAAIRSVAQRTPYLSGAAVEALIAYERMGAGAPIGPFDMLTQREQEVLEQLVLGRGNREIAADLWIGLKTVESHRAAILRKLGCTSIADLVRYAIRNGLITP